MTTTDHPTDRRAALMDAARTTCDELDAAEHARREQIAAEAVAHHLPDIMRILEEYGTDTTAGEARWHTITDPAHGLAYIGTAEGFEFEIVDGGALAGTVCWLLHPVDGARCMRIDYQSRWSHVARRLVESEPDVEAETVPVEEHPADALARVLSEFIRSVDACRTEGGF